MIYVGTARVATGMLRTRVWCGRECVCVYVVCMVCIRSDTNTHNTTPTCTPTSAPPSTHTHTLCLPTGGECSGVDSDSNIRGHRPPPRHHNVARSKGASRAAPHLRHGPLCTLWPRPPPQIIVVLIVVLFLRSAHSIF